MQNMNRLQDINKRIKKIVDWKCNGDIKEFARLINYPWEQVDEVIEGISPPTVQMLITISFICDEISTDYLLLGTAPIYNQKVVNYTTAQIYQATSKLTRCIQFIQYLDEFELEDLQTIISQLNEVVLSNRKMAEWSSRTSKT